MRDLQGLLNSFKVTELRFEKTLPP
jgi:hypothetical protein